MPDMTPDRMERGQGQIHVYTGSGKGKTTAALGLALRAAGHGYQVQIIQFLKGWLGYGELKAIAALPTVSIHPFGRSSWVHPAKLETEDYERAEKALDHARQALTGEQADIVVLDEINVALDYGLIDLDKVLILLSNRAPSVDVILTGLNAHPQVIEIADLVTEMRKIKHPFDQGTSGRSGIEF